MTLNLPEEHLFVLWELKQYLVLPCLTSFGNMGIRQLTFFTILHVFSHDHENTASIDFGVTNKCKRIDEFANIRIWSYEDQL